MAPSPAELSARDAARVALYLRDEVDAQTPLKGRKMATVEGWRSAEERLEAFLELVDPGNGKRTAKREAAEVEAIAAAFGI